MIDIKHEVVEGWEMAIKGMRNPKNSWSKSDSEYYTHGCCIGENDYSLMKTLVKAGTDHGKFLRMITVQADVNAPLYWWKEYDTYKIGTVANSCSTMHKIHAKEFEPDDFSFEYIERFLDEDTIPNIIKNLNDIREVYNNFEELEATGEVLDGVTKKDVWYCMIQLLPSSYNQLRTVQLNYQVLRNIYHSRKNHKLDEWREFCKWIEQLPYSDLITCDSSVVEANKNLRLQVDYLRLQVDSLVAENEKLCKESNTLAEENLILRGD